ncbi:glucose-6-phosphate isomerase [Candidatus Saganbacteria bacterium]|nr:glucose-6-phosphate isomerase [Candidatus Saganbacteria bacterium]
MEASVRFNESRHFGLLRSYAAASGGKHLREMFASDPNRARSFSVTTDHGIYDYSRQRLSDGARKLLLGLANERGLRGNIEAMFTGEKINVTEGRAVLHTALRNLSGGPVLLAGQDVMPDVKAVLAKVKTFSDEVLSGQRLGVTGKKIKNIIAIGIGGSYLGPDFLAEACRAYAIPGMNLRFVANVDGTDFAQKTADLNPEETMFIIVSKTFTTAETMLNAATAKQWMQGKLGTEPAVIKKHFAAVSTAKDKVEAFGIDSDNMFGFWDFVGGRYSATSAVGAVPLSLFLGYDKFEEILRGAEWMDDHFRKAPFEQNIPVLAALIDIWNINFLGFKTRALLPYCQALLKLAPHTQQVEMESNGKLVDIDGREVQFDTGEVVFGEPGTNGQHSFYQLIHQGTTPIPADFIGFVTPQYPLGTNSATGVDHHLELMANFLAQPDALAFGSENPLTHKNFPGNRPSSSLLLDKLTPFTAGLLLSMLEHRTIVKGFIWGLNSFDQWGVELGKKLGVDQRIRMLGFNATGNIDIAGLNSSTARMLESILRSGLGKEV